MHMAVYDKDGSQVSKLYDIDGNELSIAYDLDGNVIFNGSTPVGPQKDYDNYTISPMFVYNINGQAFAVYGGKIAQVRENYTLHILDIDTQSKIKEVEMDMGHGNSCQFSDEFYAMDDEFPLFYIRNSGIWVYRIVGTSSVLVKKYTFPLSILGTYVAGFGVDSVHNRLYTVSYTSGDYHSKDGLVRVAEWDMSDVTNDGNNTLTPKWLNFKDYSWWNTYNAIQGCCYHNGFLFIGTGYAGLSTQHVVMVDIKNLEIAHTIVLDGNEIEGCAWVDDDYMIVQQRPSATYRKVTFAELSE